MKVNPLRVGIPDGVNEKELREVKSSWDNVVYDIKKHVNIYAHEYEGRNLNISIRIEFDNGQTFAFIARVMKQLQVINMGFIKNGSLDPNISYRELRILNKYALDIITRIEKQKATIDQPDFSVSIDGIYEEPAKVNIYKPKEEEINFPESESNVVIHNSRGR